MKKEEKEIKVAALKAALESGNKAKIKAFRRKGLEAEILEEYERLTGRLVLFC